MFPALILTLLQPLLTEHPERSLEISPTWSFHTDPAFSLLRLKFLNGIRGGLLLHLLCIHSFSIPSDWHHKGCSVIFPADPTHTEMPFLSRWGSDGRPQEQFYSNVVSWNITNILQKHSWLKQLHHWRALYVWVLTHVHLWNFLTQSLHLAPKLYTDT